MTGIAKVEAGVIKLPAELSSRLGNVSRCSIEAREDGSLVLRPIDPDQRWFWTEEWQKGEAEADRDIREGRVIHHLNDEDFLKSL
jgi:hypothetical protein